MCNSRHKRSFHSIIESRNWTRRRTREPVFRTCGTSSGLASLSIGLVERVQTKSKGKGLFILLHGVPGIGKTATATAEPFLRQVESLYSRSPAEILSWHQRRWSVHCKEHFDLLTPKTVSYCSRKSILFSPRDQRGMILWLEMPWFQVIFLIKSIHVLYLDIRNWSPKLSGCWYS